MVSKQSRRDPYRRSGWHKLTMLDMILAYRKAKVDCFYEQSLCVAEQFAEYEQDIEDRLVGLLDRLREQGAAKVLDEVRLDETLVVLPKKLKLEPENPDRVPPHPAVFSDRRRAADAAFQSSKVTAELRVSGEFPIEVYIISALWTNLVGHRFDACLGDDVYGARLRRFGDDGAPNNRPYHLWATGSFPPYFLAYAKWRERGLRACRRAIEDGQRIIAVNLDIRRYYHSIDPSFITKDRFHRQIGLVDTKEPLLVDANGALNSFERRFTQEWVSFLSRWSECASMWIRSAGGNVEQGGLPLALTAARVMANVLLAPWDRQIRTRLSPLFYGRYVDDMQLVLADPGDRTTATEVLRFIGERLGMEPVTLSEGTDDSFRIDLGQLGGQSDLRIQPNKVRAFVLEGNAGRDLIDVIEREVGELSSERRLLPDPDQLTHSIAARVLSASTDPATTPDRLGRSDGPSIRRFGWSVQLAQARTLADDLPAPEWSRIRDAMFEFAGSHILRADRFFDHWDQVPRLLEIAVMCGDWAAALQVVRLTLECLETIESRATAVDLNGQQASQADANGSLEGAWTRLREHVTRKLREAVIRWAAIGGRPSGAEDRGELSHERQRLLQEVGIDAESLQASCQRLCRHDLGGPPARLDTEQAGVEAWVDGGESISRILEAINHADSRIIPDIREFLRLVVKHSPGSESLAPLTPQPADLRPFLFPTRPFRFDEFPAIDPRCIQDISRWRRYARAFRGVWVGESAASPEEQGAAPPNTAGSGGEGASHAEGDRPEWIRVGIKQAPRAVRIALANLRTEDTAWAASAAGTPMLTLARYQQLAELVNDILRKRPRPDYLILPELSLPEAWCSSLTRRLSDSGVNLIAGLEYRHYPSSEVRSHALLHLLDDRLGFTAPLRIDQPKAGPAVGEEFELLRVHGRTWRVPNRSEWCRVYEHHGIVFGVLVCSELQDIHRRAILRGWVDALAVPSWNRDLGTFSALVESAALDVHAFVAYVNNRSYGDSRVRSPAREDHLRDLARIRGGLHDGFVMVEVDPGPLREFQSRARSWPQPSDHFKPVPSGFVCHPRRRWSYLGTD
ncbi:MAG: hypothetical protein KF724_11675 [Phycisphaeraceae bacterium]|nr:hypothetical protein [Phycisphaeraceae bacterium]